MAKITIVLTDSKVEDQDGIVLAMQAEDIGDDQQEVTGAMLFASLIRRIHVSGQEKMTGLLEQERERLIAEYEAFDAAEEAQPQEGAK